MIPLPSAATCSGPCSCDYVVLYMFYHILYKEAPRLDPSAGSHLGQQMAKCSHE